MCRFTISTHTYSGCKLVEETQDETPTPRATFLGRITNAFVTTTPGENTPLVTNEDGRHVITQKEIIQCSKALDDPAQNGKLPGERRCAKLTPLRKEEGIPAEPPLSKFKGGCPACQAGEDAVRAALTKETIFPVEVPMRPVSRGHGSNGARHVHHSAVGKEIKHGKPRKQKGGGCHSM